MDIIYKIYSVYLYDNQLNHDYLLLYNRVKSFTGDLNSDLPYMFSGMHKFGALYNINCLKKDEDINKISIEIMSETAKKEKIPFICVKDFLTIKKIKETHNPKYSIYEIYWNETKSGINIHDFELAAVWNPGQSSYSTYRIYEEKENRDLVMRDHKLKKIK